MSNIHHYTGHYLGVFTSNKSSPKWRAWYAMTDEQQRATDEVGLAALKKWDEDHAADIVYAGGALGPPSARQRPAWRTSSTS